MDHSEHPGTPQRPPASAHLLVDSRDRGVDSLGNPSGSAANFRIYNNNNLMYGYFTRFAVTQVQFWWEFPTIATDYNDILFIQNVTAATQDQVQIVSGYYNPTTLAAAIQTALRASAPLNIPAATCVFDDLSNGFIIDSNGAGTGPDLDFVSPVTADPGKGALFYKLVRSYRTMGVPVALFGAGGLPILPLAVPQMIGTQYVDIVSRNLTKYQRAKDTDTAPQNTRSNIIFRLYVCPPGQRVQVYDTEGPGTFPFLICVDPNTPKHIKWSPGEALAELDLQVLDMDGQQLYWDQTFAPWEYQLTLIASET